MDENNCKRTSSVLMAQVWEPPHIAEPDAEPDLSQEVLYFTVPACSSWRLRLLLALICVSVDLRLAIFSWQGLLLHLGQEEEIKEDVTTQLCNEVE